jgi:uncharacterized heparinase superfamily protein
MTLRFMQLRQLLSMLRYRLLRTKHTVPAVGTDVGLAGVDLDRTLEPSGFDPGQFRDHICFLNHAVPVGETGVDWRGKGLPKLWRYNLHYFDYLLWPGLGNDRKASLIDSWIEENPVGSEDAWEPYTVSLRLVNWIKFFVSSPVTVKPSWRKSLALQAQRLSRNLETHILANHYLKNAKALVFAGTFFEGADAQRWLRIGQAVFTEQVDEQFLPSGAHYELSPMYHCICTEDLLDVTNLTQSNPALFDEKFVEQVGLASRKALDFLAAILMPDGRIPLFNDSAFGIAAEPAQLFGYGGRLFNYRLPSSPSRSFDDAGLFVLGDTESRMIVDCGPVSPAYQPGHTHCDMLSFELAFAGRSVIVDTGVFDYENSTERKYCRSTAAHNTVSVDGQDQSELWSVFRVARRAKVLGAKIENRADGTSRFIGEIAAFPEVDGRIRHRREIMFDPADGYRIRDTVSGNGRHKVTGYLHLHPQLTLVQMGDHLQVADMDGKPVAMIFVAGPIDATIEKSEYFPEFGIRQDRLVIQLSTTTTLPLSFECQIDRVRH